MPEQNNKPKTSAASSGANPAARPAPAAKPTAARPAANPARPTPPPARPAPATAGARPAPQPNAARPAASGTKPTPAPAARPTATATRPAAATATRPTQAAKPVTTAQAGSARPAPAAKPTAATQTTAAARPTAAKPTAASAAKPAERTASAKQPDKKPTEKKNARNGDKGKNSVLQDKKVRIVIASAVVFLVLLGVILGIVLGVKGCNKDSSASVSKMGLDYYDTDAHKTNTAVGFYGKVTNENVPRNKPVAETRDERDNFPLTGIDIPEGGVRYPKYGYTMSSVLGSSDAAQAARAALIDESDYLTAYGTRNNSGNGSNGKGTYNMMDKDGWLYFANGETVVQALNEDDTPRRLYKHSAADGMYYEGYNTLPMLSDDEPAIEKVVTVRPRGYGSYSVTGVYAPAGEVIKIQISEEDMEATGGIAIHIGQALYNGQSNNIWVAKGQMQRFPNILNTMVVNKSTATLENGVYTAYVGSFVGGPLYIRNTLAPFTATISGGVRYSHFILGYTTKEEFEKDRQSTAPYFDLEVWNYGVLHSGPKLYSLNFSYDDLYKVAVLWDKVASVTTTGSRQGIVFLYDPFVAAGAAVAFPGRSSVNCPGGWMTGSLNYNSIVNSGSWGNFHEYHHNFQGYGVGNGGEVTNNGMTLVSYALFTKISAKRGMSNFGAQGLGGWNNYTSAPWALEEVLKIARSGESPSNGNQGLALYATLLHNFGPNNYIQAKVTQRGGQNYAAYFQSWQNVTHNNMAYYFSDILKGLSASEAANLGNADYPMFVPVSSVYQTGRSYLYDGEKKYIETMQPYVIPYGDSFTVDLRRYSAPANQYAQGSIVLPEAFDYEIKAVTQPENGTFTETGTKGVYTYTPANKNGSLRSGKIYVTLQLTKKDGAFQADDVDLVLEFEQSYEFNKWTLKRTTYTYTADTMYQDAQTAYERGFKGYTEVSEADHTNPVQNCNTDIWFYADTEQQRLAHPDAPESHFVKANTVAVLAGKLYAENAGKYRIYLRGRKNCALYYSVDGGKNYTLGATIKDIEVPKNSAVFRGNDNNTYFDVELGEKSWVYIKEVLICEQFGNTTSFIGVGMAAWTEPMFTMQEKYYDKNGKEVASPEAEGYDHTKTHYYNYLGIEVTEEVANKAELIPPVLSGNVNQLPYVNAYRDTYEFISGDFETDYFYTRTYNYDYTDNVWANREQTLISTNYTAGVSWNFNNYKPEYLTDGNRNTFIHTKNGVGGSPEKPLEFVIDMGEVRAVNRMTIYTQNRPNGDWHAPKNFTLYGSTDGNEFFTVGEFTDAPRSGTAITVNFPEQSFRYYRLVITGSHASLIIIGEIEMWRVFEITGGNQIAPDNVMFRYEGAWRGTQACSTFGHIYAGKQGATMTFTFTGTRLGILSSSAFGSDFEVQIDGKRVDSLALKEFDGAGMSYLCDKLQSGEHTVTIRCNGDASIDSIVLYNEA